MFYENPYFYPQVPNVQKGVPYYPIGYVPNPYQFGYPLPYYYEHSSHHSHRHHHSSRQLPQFKHGPERISERPPHTQHVDWHSLFPNEVILSGPTDRKIVALTFDDGPDDVWTPQILAVLAQYQIKATFNCVGSRVAQNPQMLQRMAREGHILANHSWDHPNFTKITLAEARDEIERTSQEIQRVAGVRPRYFRPPYGALDRDVIDEVIKLGYKILFWDVDSLDWAGLTGPQAAANVLAHTGPGAIILMHFAGGKGESLEDTVQALPYIITTLREEGYSFDTVPQLINQPPYRSSHKNKK